MINSPRTQYMINSAFDAAYTLANSGDDPLQQPLNLMNRGGDGLENVT